MNKNLKIKKSDRSEISRAFALLSQIGINLVLIMGLCFFIGRFLDEKLHTTPLFLFIFIILGIATSFRSLYKTGMQNISPDIEKSKTDRETKIDIQNESKNESVNESENEKER